MTARFRQEGRSYANRLLPLLITVLVVLPVLCHGAVSDASAACQGDHSSSSAAPSFFLHNRAHHYDQDDFTAIANIAPPMRNGETHHDRDRVDALLRHYWSSSLSSSSTSTGGGGTTTTSSSRSGYYHHDRSTTPPTIGTGGNQTTTSDKGGGGIEFTYGELTPLGVRQLAHWMKLSDGTSSTTTGRERRPVTFFDVGSGVGKLVIQMYWENHHVDNDDSFRAVGIEYCTIRHGIAAKVWNEIVAQRSKTYVGGSCFAKEEEEEDDDDVLDTNVRLNDQEKDQQRERPVVEFRHQDARSTDFTAATHVFLSSLCFPRDLTDAIARQLIDTDAAPHLQVVAALSTLRPFQNDTTSWTETTHEIQTSWGRARVHVYIRHRRRSLEQEESEEESEEASAATTTA